MTYDIISKRNKSVKIQSPEDLYQFLKRYANNRQELFLTITLNGAHEVMGIHITTVGLVNKTVVHPREIFIRAIKDNATSIIVAHNHPSNNLKPSPEDLDMTEKIISAGEIVGIPLLDHLIITKNGFYSMRKNNDCF